MVKIFLYIVYPIICGNLGSSGEGPTCPEQVGEIFIYNLILKVPTRIINRNIVHLYLVIVTSVLKIPNNDAKMYQKG